MVTLNSCGTSSFWLFTSLCGDLFENSPRRSSQRFFRGAARFHFSSRDTGREEAGTICVTPQNKLQFTEKYRGFHKWDPMGVSIHTHTYIYM